MIGHVYRHRDSWRVYFRGTWFTSDEYGRPFRAEFYAYSFLALLNGLYSPDPAKNRYDPKQFKRQGPYRFDEAFELYLDRHETDSGWQNGKKWIGNKHLIPFFGIQDFRTIDGVQLESFQKFLWQKGLSGKTIWNIFATLHGFLNHPSFRSSFHTFPVFPKVRYQQPKIRWFTDAEINQVFRYLPEEDLGYFWAIRGYGLRPEEASGLLRSAVNLETKEIIISTVFVNGKMKARTKTGTERAIPTEICPEAEAYLGLQSGSTFVFSTGGRPYSAQMRESRWKKAMKLAIKECGTRRMTLRDLRHSAATKWAKKVSLDIVRRLLGHSSQKTTETFYADIDLHRVVDMVRK